MELNPTTVKELVTGLDWFAFPLVALTLLPAIILAINKILAGIGVEMVAKWKFYLALTIIYLSALVSIKAGATLEDRYKVRVRPISTCFERERVTVLSFSEVRTRSGTDLNDEELKRLTVKHSTSFSLGNGSSLDSLALIYIDSAGVDRIYRALKRPAIGYIRQYLDSWSLSGKPNVPFSRIHAYDPRMTYEFCEWLAQQKDLRSDSLIMTVYPVNSGSINEVRGSYAFEYIRK